MDYNFSVNSRLLNSSRVLIHGLSLQTACHFSVLMPSPLNFFIRSMIFLRFLNTTLSKQFFGKNFQSIVSDFFSDAWSIFSHVEVLLKTLRTVPSITFLLYFKGAQPLKHRMVPVSVCFWYHSHVIFFLSPR